MHLTWQDLAAVCDGERFAAEHLQLPLTTFLTVNWRTGLRFASDDTECWASHHTRLVKSMERWLKARGIPIVYAYVRERVIGRGAHTHFMIHLPQTGRHKLALSLRDHLQTAGKFRENSAVHIDNPLGGGMTKPQQRLGLLTYLGKGINPNEMVNTGAGVALLSAFLGIEPKSQAIIPCKRVGMSENIQASARRQAGYRDIDDILRLADHLPLKQPDAPKSS